MKPGHLGVVGVSRRDNTATASTHFRSAISSVSHPSGYLHRLWPSVATLRTRQFLASLWGLSEIVGGQQIVSKQFKGLGHITCNINFTGELKASGPF